MLYDTIGFSRKKIPETEKILFNIFSSLNAGPKPID